jgi:malate dehydrogenase (oxaloacetate-decarboxylating)
VTELPSVKRGAALLNDPELNKGTAFTDIERAALGLRGLLPPRVMTQDEQLERILPGVRSRPTPLDQYSYLVGLHDRNVTLFYRLVIDHLEEMMPILYTPTVGQACQEFGRIFRRSRGLFITAEDKGHVREVLANWPHDTVRMIVVTDGERILGLGDQGIGGMGIPIGKLALYTGCGGLHPATTLPIMLDVGTDNPDCLADPLYIGWRNERVRGQQYDDFIEAFVSAVVKRWPHVLLQWEDFAKNNATRMLERYRDRLLTFNDDIQGTAAVATGALLSAINVTGVPRTEQRVAGRACGTASHGAAPQAQGAAGRGVSDNRREFLDTGHHVFSPLSSSGWPSKAATFFWTSMTNRALSSRLLSLSLSRVSSAIRSTWSRSAAGLGPRFRGASAASSAALRCLRQVLRLDEYTPSRRINAPISPGALQRSAA